MLRSCGLAGMGLALALGAADAQKAAPAAQPPFNDPRIEAFLEGCVFSLSDLAATRERLKAAGWQPALPWSHPELQAIYITAAQGADALQDARFTLETYTRRVWDWQIHLVLTGNVPEAGAAVNSCQVYDFAADDLHGDPDLHGTIERRLGARPTKGIFQNVVRTRKEWTVLPGHAGLTSVTATSIPASSPMAAGARFSGLAWTATAMTAKPAP